MKQEKIVKNICFCPMSHVVSEEWNIIHKNLLVALCSFLSVLFLSFLFPQGWKINLVIVLFIIYLSGTFLGREFLMYLSS